LRIHGVHVSHKGRRRVQSDCGGRIWTDGWTVIIGLLILGPQLATLVREEQEVEKMEATRDVLAKETKNQA
jgi:hypothetical protein